MANKITRVSIQGYEPGREYIVWIEHLKNGAMVPLAVIERTTVITDRSVWLRQTPSTVVDPEISRILKEALHKSTPPAKLNRPSRPRKKK